jgi:hypothetical protein
MKLLSKLSGIARGLGDIRTTARHPCHNDVYLVEFPKSGITWLSCLLANAALSESGRPEVASYAAAHQFVPDIHVTRNVGRMPYERPPVRLIKSHAEFNPSYIFVIYLVRHPLSVMKSRYRFMREVHGNTFGTFDDFCKNTKWGLNAWKRHVNSWLVGKVSAQRLHLVRYEDLLSNASQELRFISRNFGWNLQEESILRAVSLSSIKEMRASEEFYQARNPKYRMKFVGGLNEFDVSRDAVALVESTCEKELAILGYGQ